MLAPNIKNLEIKALILWLSLKTTSVINGCSTLLSIYPKIVKATIAIIKATKR